MNIVSTTVAGRIPPDAVSTRLPKTGCRMRGPFRESV
jgi:hypothetical protein